MTNVAVKKPEPGELINAAGNGDVKEVEALLLRGADANEEDERLGSPLSVATEQGYTEIVRLLLAYGADAKKKPSHGITDLMSAALDGYTEIARLLIDSGAEVNAADNRGLTALMYAVMGNGTVFGSGNGLEVMRLLIDKGADIGMRDRDDDTARDIAIKFDEPEMAEFLQEKLESRLRAAAEAHDLSFKNQKSLKARVPKVVIKGLKP